MMRRFFIHIRTPQLPILKRRSSPFIIGLLIILAITALLCLLSYDFGLPYVEKIEEPNYYLAGLEWRGLFDNDGYYNGVPPAYIALHAGLQPVLEAGGIRDLSPTVRVMRLLSVGAHLLTVVMIGVTGLLAGGALAGVIAAALWAFSPFVLVNEINALPDPWVYCFVAVSLCLATVAVVDPERRWWSVGSTVAGLLAILMKYPAVPVLGVGIIPPLLLALRDRRKGLAVLAVQAILIAGTAFWLIFMYGVDFNNLQREGAIVRNQGLSNMLNLERVANNINQTLWPLNPLVFLALLALAIPAYILARRRRGFTVNLTVAGLCAVLFLTIPWLAASFSDVDEAALRYVLPAITAACVLMGIAAAQVATLRNNKVGATVVILTLTALIFLPNLMRTWSEVQLRRLPDRRVALRQWFDVNLEPGTVLVDQENHKTFNPIWGGIPYHNWVDWWVTDNLMEHQVSEWRDERGMSYAVIPKAELQQMQTNSAGQAYLGEMLHLRDFFNSPPGRGPQMSVFRLWLPQHETAVKFGESIQLVGYDLSGQDVKPGDTLTLQFYWQAETTPPDNYSLFIHVVPLDDYTVLAQGDGAPANSERPTLTWNRPDETLISPTFSISLPPDLAPGEYRVMIGLYNYLDGTRLTIQDAEGNSPGDAMELTRLTVGK
jgi:hypothetical protein